MHSGKKFFWCRRCSHEFLCSKCNSQHRECRGCFHDEPSDAALCLNESLEAIMCKKITGFSRGPYWALADGNRMLKPFSKMLVPIHLQAATSDGRFVIHKKHHFKGLMVMFNQCIRLLIDEKTLSLMTRAELADLSNDSGSSAFKLTDFADTRFSVLSTPTWWTDADRIAGGRRGAPHNKNAEEKEEVSLSDSRKRLFVQPWKQLLIGEEVRPRKPYDLMTEFCSLSHRA